MFETFRIIDNYLEAILTQKDPSCFNGIVRVFKYKITFEKIDEPIEVIAQRLQALWDKCDNRHNWGPLRAAAKNIKYTLKGPPGSKI